MHGYPAERGPSKQPEASRAPRLLLVSHAFPPRNTAAAIRAYDMAKWLTRKGWIVTVLTPHASAWGIADGADAFADELSMQGIRCIRTPHQRCWLLGLRSDDGKNPVARSVGRHVAALLGIEREVGWARDAEKACAGLVPEDVDLILASGPPFVSFSLAKRVAEKLGKRYALDYRELCALAPRKRSIRRNRTLAEEQIVLARSAATIAVSEFLALSLKRGFAMEASPHVIPDRFGAEHDIQRYEVVERLDRAMREVLTRG